MDRYRIQLLSQEGQDNLFPLINAESLNNIDLNNMREEGIFYFNANNEATNAPSGATSGFGLQILRLTDSNYIQLAWLNDGSGILQTRIYNGSSWSSWSEISGGGDSVNWNDITNKPTWITNGEVSWDNIINKPTWATGDNLNWTDITNIPSGLVTNVTISGSGNAVTNAAFSGGTLTLTKGTISGGGDTGDVYWDDILNKPTWVTTDYSGLFNLATNFFTNFVDENYTLLALTSRLSALTIGSSDWTVQSNNLTYGGNTPLGKQLLMDGTDWVVGNDVIFGLSITIPHATPTTPGVVTLNEAGGGSSVSVEAIQTSGTHIATITVDGSQTQLFAPTSGGTTSLPNRNVVTGVGYFTESKSASSVSCSSICSTYNLATGTTANVSTVLELTAATSTQAGVMTADMYNQLSGSMTQTSADTRYVKITGNDTKTGTFAIRPSSGTSTYPFSIYPATATSANARASFGMMGSDPSLWLTMYDTSGEGHMAFTVAADTGAVTFSNAINVTQMATFNGAVVINSAMRNGGNTFRVETTGAVTAASITSSGTITASAFYQSSDKNYKENIVAIDEEDIEKIKNVELVSYNFKNDDTKRYGVVAQEVEEAGLANLVHTDSKDKKTVDYISLLILKIEQLQKEVNELKSKVYGG